MFFLFIKLCFRFVFSLSTYPPVLLVLFPHELLLGYVAQSCHGWNLLEVPAFCLGACDLTFV
jgi:hypothetical protein